MIVVIITISSIVLIKQFLDQICLRQGGFYVDTDGIFKGPKKHYSIHQLLNELHCHLGTQWGRI